MDVVLEAIKEERAIKVKIDGEVRFSVTAD